MKLSDIPIPLTGETLMTSITQTKDQRKPIAEGLLYEKTILMVASDPGVGKSTVSTQVAVELANGLPIFGYFKVEEPTKVLIIQTERSILETLERLEVINKTIPINTDNLIVTDEYQRLDLLKDNDMELFMQCIHRDYQQAKVIIIDPIYTAVGGGLKEDLPATKFCKTMNIIQKEFNCALWYNHHTVKAQYSSQSGVRIEKDDPFYGSQWLKAHVTGSFYMRRNDNGITLTKKKDNYDILIDSIRLEYDPETELCHVSEGNLPSIDKLQNYLKIKRLDKFKTFTFKEMQEGTGLCTRTLRKLLLHTLFKDALITTSGKNNKKLYHFKG